MNKKFEINFFLNSRLTFYSKMANVGQWELVVKGSKKRNTAVSNGRLTKTEKKQFAENAPKLTNFGM